MSPIATLLLITGLAAHLIAAVPTQPVIAPRGEAAAPAPVVDAVYDGSCYYPVPDAAFPEDLSAYTGRWYQLAGTPQIFTAACACTYAEYGLTPNGTVSVENVCQLPLGLRNAIAGEASPVAPAYGARGTFQVRFPSVPGGGVTCPGPNYIVQKYGGDYAIVQAPAFDGFFLLSRAQHPPEEDVETWLAEAGSLGTNLAKVQRVSQENCQFT
ncbi:lipocalin-like domain-containing protein [Apiospora kogelbergensis]|uniref:lipocalin-like domain-containing protein n=1 Tax=Apiospora kogelbergensis TaxID=1337665 RepID=UPI00313010D1